MKSRILIFILAIIYLSSVLSQSLEIEIDAVSKESVTFSSKNYDYNSKPLFKRNPDKLRFLEGPNQQKNGKILILFLLIFYKQKF